MSKEKLEIKSPHCKEDNSINLSKEIRCKNCDKSLLIKKYAKRALIPSSIILVTGLCGGVYIDEKLETDRYPLKAEYNIVQSCISQDSRALSRKDYLEKIDICICAHEETIENISYSDFKENKSKFLNIFEVNVRKCM